MATATAPPEAEPERIPSVSLAPDPVLPGGESVNAVAAQALPEEVCRHFRMLPVNYDGQALVLAMADPADAMARSVAAALSPTAFEIARAPAEQIDAAIDRVFSGLGHAGGPGPREAPRLARIGEILLDRGLIGEPDLSRALAEQRRGGGRVGEILAAAEAIGADAPAAALADQLRVPLVDVAGIEPSPAAVAAIPASVQRERGCVPLAMDEEVLYVAIADPLDDATYAAIRASTDRRVRTYMVLAAELDALLGKVHSAEPPRAEEPSDGEEAASAPPQRPLVPLAPSLSARRALSAGQLLAPLLALSALAAGFALAPALTALVVVTLVAGAALLASAQRLALSLGRRRELDSAPVEDSKLGETELPRYTILVPLLGPAASIPRLIECLSELDYPAERLEILLLCDERDPVLAAELPAPFEPLIVPATQLRTIAGALNFGLKEATGRYVAVFTPGDEPEPDQLRQALAAWERAAADTAGLQTKLLPFNPDQNTLTRLGTMEALLRSDLVLPGLSAAGAPLPLGPSGYHLDREALFGVGGWDPFSVTEGADVGLRLQRDGRRAEMLASTTLTEASFGVRSWMRRRALAARGQLGTYLVHMRQPLRLLREIGSRAWLSLQLRAGGTVALMLGPVLALAALLWPATDAGLIDDPLARIAGVVAAVTLLLAALAFTFLAAAAARRRGVRGLARYALLAPLYLAGASVAAGLGLLGLFARQPNRKRESPG